MGGGERRLTWHPVRTTRARIIRLRNDYKEHMALVEQHLHERFASLDENEAPPAMMGSSSTGAPVSDPEPAQPPFAKVNTVAEGSPASSAGLKPGDEIRTFGYVNSSNHDSLKRVGECVQGNEGVSLLCPNLVILACRLLGLVLKRPNKQQNIFVRVSRATDDVARRQELRLTLTPRRDWGGRGMLGCHIVPLS